MGVKIFLDTSVLVELQINNLAARAAFRTLEDNCDFVISRIVSMEFISGSKNAKQLRDNISFLSNFDVYEINESVSKNAYDLITKLNLTTTLSLPDALIAATAIHYGLALWTLNTKHFKNIKGLKLFKA